MCKILKVAREKNLFKNKKYLAKFGAITEGLRSQTKAHLSYQFVMTLRRFILAALVVYNHLTTQMLGYRLLTIFLMIYVGQVRASWSVRYDLAHEFIIVTQGTLLPLYTAFVPDPHARHSMGNVSSFLFIA